MEDVKISQTYESGLEKQSQGGQLSVEESGAPRFDKLKDDDESFKQTKAFFTKTLNYLLQFLPPMAMLLVQVKFHIHNFFSLELMTFENLVFRNKYQEDTNDRAQS